MSSTLGKHPGASKTQACVPCSKRKVRCDRGEPCSNCQRRKTDICTYVDPSPNDRLKRLEALVRRLGGDPEATDEVVQHRYQQKSSPSQDQLEVKAGTRGSAGNANTRQGDDSIMVKEQNEAIYLESSAWPDWNGKNYGPLSKLPAANADIVPKAFYTALAGDDALTSLLAYHGHVDFATKHPAPRDAATLWRVFYDRVHPVLKVFFAWEVEELKSSSISPTTNKSFSNQEHAFLFALYLISSLSLSEDECWNMLRRKKLDLLQEFQWLCEQALAAANFLASTDIIMLQALTIYLAAGFNRLNRSSLGPLAGLVSRKAERLGLHRDGTFLNLPPVETERRRRIWWQLLYVDLGVGALSGTTPLTIMADWDTRLPLNIEDDDMKASMREFPAEREGLTSMSHCLWRYWVLYEQRTFRRVDGGRFGLFWISNRTLSYEAKLGLVKRLEDGLTERYLRYCNPIKPLEMMILITARALITALHRTLLHPLLHDGKAPDYISDYANKFSAICMQCLEYDISSHSTQSIKNFQWHTQNYFQWSALIFVLIEARKLYDTPKAEAIWELIDRVYSANNDLANFQSDGRKTYAAELIVAAWKAREDFLLSCHQKSPELYFPPQKPAFVADLESRLSKSSIDGQLPQGPKKRKANTAFGVSDSHRVVKDTTMSNGQSNQVSHDTDPVEKESAGDLDMSTFGDFDFGDIDWSFWDGIDDNQPLPFFGALHRNSEVIVSGTQVALVPEVTPVIDISEAPPME